MYAPLVIFTYNRKQHTKNLIESLKKCDLIHETEVFIFSDGNKGEKDLFKVSDVREYLESLQGERWCKSLVVNKSSKNKGLATSIISGVSDIIEKYGRVIVLEDDLVVAEGFLKYMNQALDYYEYNEKIWSISGFSSAIPMLENSPNDIYFSCRARSWSWATWKDRWDTVDWNVKAYKKFRLNLAKRKQFNRGGSDMSAMLDRQQAGIINSWAIRWCFNQFLQDKYVVQPTISLIVNKGQDGSGTNCSKLREDNAISNTKKDWNFIPFQYKPEIDEELAKRKKVPTYKLLGSFIIFVILNIRAKNNEHHIVKL